MNAHSIPSSLAGSSSTTTTGLLQALVFGVNLSNSISPHKPISGIIGACPTSLLSPLLKAAAAVENSQWSEIDRFVLGVGIECTKDKGDGLSRNEDVVHEFHRVTSVSCPLNVNVDCTPNVYGNDHPILSQVLPTNLLICNLVSNGHHYSNPCPRMLVHTLLAPLIPLCLTVSVYHL